MNFNILEYSEHNAEKKKKIDFLFILNFNCFSVFKQKYVHYMSFHTKIMDMYLKFGGLNLMASTNILNLLVKLLFLN